MNKNKKKETIKLSEHDRKQVLNLLMFRKRLRLPQNKEGKKRNAERRKNTV